MENEFTKPFKVGDKVVALYDQSDGWFHKDFVYEVYSTFKGIKFSGAKFIRFCDNYGLNSSISFSVDCFRLATEQDIKNDKRVRETYRAKREKEKEISLRNKLKEEIKREYLKEAIKNEMIQAGELS